MALFSRPHQIKHPPLERPVFHPRHESFAQWVFLHVKPLLRVVLAVAQTVVPAARLKSPLRPLVFQTELALPVGNPVFNREMQIVRSTKSVKRGPASPGNPDGPRPSLPTGSQGGADALFRRPAMDCVSQS